MSHNSKYIALKRYKVYKRRTIPSKPDLHHEVFFLHKIRVN